MPNKLATIQDPEFEFAEKARSGAIEATDLQKGWIVKKGPTDPVVGTKIVHYANVNGTRKSREPNLVARLVGWLKGKS